MTALAHKDTMSSREIARITGRPHNDVMKAIRNMEYAWKKINGGNFSLVEYKDKKGEMRPEYQLNKHECLYIATKFNDEARAKLVMRWAELEEKEKMARPKLPQQKEHYLKTQIKEERFELICLIRQYMKRGDMAGL